MPDVDRESFPVSRFLLLLHPTMEIYFCLSFAKIFAWEETWNFPNLLQIFFLEYSESWQFHFSTWYSQYYCYCEIQPQVLCQTAYLWKHGETKLFCLHIRNKASKVQHKNVFVSSYSALHVSKQLSVATSCLLEQSCRWRLPQVTGLME